MKTMGLLGGMSWESTQVYYRIINREVRERLGGLSSARMILYSVEFGAMAADMQAGRWGGVEKTLIAAARSVEKAGAEFLLICTNTMHRFYEQVEAAVDIPLLHIADATARELQKRGVRSVGLTGTAPTMEEDFYRGRLAQRHGLEVLTPGEADRAELNRIIFQELCQGKALPASREKLAAMLAEMSGRGCGGHILGCTELALLIEPCEQPLPILDTAAVHALAAVEMALS